MNAILSYSTGPRTEIQSSLMTPLHRRQILLGLTPVSTGRNEHRLMANVPAREVDGLWLYYSPTYCLLSWQGYILIPRTLAMIRSGKDLDVLWKDKDLSLSAVGDKISRDCCRTINTASADWYRRESLYQPFGTFGTETDRGMMCRFILKISTDIKRVKDLKNWRRTDDGYHFGTREELPGDR